MTAAFSIGLSALTTAQRALDIVGENISNANTPGYHRQVEVLAERPPDVQAGLAFGTGVQLQDIQRQRSIFLDQALNQQASGAAATDAQLQTLQELESFLGSGNGSIQNGLQTFFNGLEQLASSSHDVAQRRVVLGDAQALTAQFNAVAGQIDSQRASVDAQIDNTLAEINTQAGQIADLNGQIQRLASQQTPANDLADQRDQLINELAQRISVQTIEHADGQTTVLAGGALLVGGDKASALARSTDAAGQVVVTPVGGTTPLTITSGKLAGLLQVRNQFLNDYRTRLDTLARGLGQALDGFQATGLGLGGPQILLSGLRGVSSPTAPLAQGQFAFPPQAGSLFITVTDKGTGRKTLNEIQIDPATQSLNDVAAAVSAVPHLNAVVDSQTRTLTVLAQPGFAFDFAGGLQGSPGTAGITGTTAPTVGGVYSGTANDRFTYKVAGSGTVGVTTNLTLQVVNSANSVVASLNIGQGYEPGTPLTVANGVTVKLSAGTANAGDTFSSQVVARPDTAGILPALGLNPFFLGQGARDFRVQPGLVADPTQLGASRTGQPGDGSVLQQMAAVRDQKLLGNGTQTLSEAYAAMVGNIGTQVQQLQQVQGNQQLLGQQLQAQRQGVSGVDPNQELVRMLQFQRSFQVAAKYISAVNASLDDLFKLF